VDSRFYNYMQIPKRPAFSAPGSVPLFSILSYGIFRTSAGGSPFEISHSEPALVMLLFENTTSVTALVLTHAALHSTPRHVTTFAVPSSGTHTDLPGDHLGFALWPWYSRDRVTFSKFEIAFSLFARLFLACLMWY
jgi:hypothetical protein